MDTAYTALQKRIGISVRHARKEPKLSQLKLWELSGVDFTMISKIERGVTNPSLLTLHRLAVALDVPIEDFFFLAAA